MTRDEWLSGFNHAPPAVQEYLLDTVSGQRESAAQTQLNYENDAWDRMMDAVWELVFRKLSYAEFNQRLKQLAGDRKIEDVERAILLQIVLPLADLVTWDVEARMQELHITMAEIQAAPRVSLRPVSYGAAARRIAATAKISVLSEDMVRKLRDVIVSYLKGVRGEEQVKELLVRQQVEGGLGLTKDQAKAFYEAILNFMATTQVMSEQEYALWFQNFQREASVTQAEAAAKSAVTLPEGVTAAEMPRSESKFDPILGKAIDDVLQKIGKLPEQEHMLRRLQNVISTRLRDVRNAVQTRGLLEREEKVGGLGYTPEDAARIADLIEQAYNQNRESIGTEEKQRIEAAQEETKKKVEERKKRESEEHAAWFREKVAASRPESATEQLRELMLHPQVPTEGASKPLSKPSMMDVTPPQQRLTGLAEELGTMDIDSFRRQAKSPDQAAEKIFQKLETLKRESFDRWTEGVAAWRKSPVQQQYLKLVTESFTSATPVAQLVEEKRKTDPKLPTAEELGAIISLNAKIQY